MCLYYDLCLLMGNKITGIWIRSKVFNIKEIRYIKTSCSIAYQYFLLSPVIIDFNWTIWRKLIICCRVCISYDQHRLLIFMTIRAQIEYRWQTINKWCLLMYCISICIATFKSQEYVVRLKINFSNNHNLHNGSVVG